MSENSSEDSWRLEMIFLIHLIRIEAWIRSYNSASQPQISEHRLHGNKNEEKAGILNFEF